MKGLPKVGDEIYIPTHLYLSRGADDIAGGLGKVKALEADGASLWVEVEEIPGRRFNWFAIENRQEKLAEEFGDQRCYPDPDNHPSANTGRL